MADARTLLDQIRHQLERLHTDIEEAKHYLERAEPHEAQRPLNDGRSTLRDLEQRWEELHRLTENF